MEMETTDSRGKEKSSQPVAMDDKVFKEHVKTLDQKYIQTIHDIELYVALRISGSDNEMVKGKLLIHINDSVNEILHEVDEVCYFLDENVHKEKYDQIK